MGHICKLLGLQFTMNAILSHLQSMSLCIWTECLVLWFWTAFLKRPGHPDPSPLKLLLEMYCYRLNFASLFAVACFMKTVVQHSIDNRINEMLTLLGKSFLSVSEVKSSNIGWLESDFYSAAQKESVPENKGSWWETVLRNHTPADSTQLRWKAAQNLLFTPWNSTTTDCQSAEHSPLIVDSLYGRNCPVDVLMDFTWLGQNIDKDLLCLSHLYGGGRVCGLIRAHYLLLTTHLVRAATKTFICYDPLIYQEFSLFPDESFGVKNVVYSFTQSKITHLVLFHHQCYLSLKIT